MKPEHYERKHQKMLSLPPTVIRWLEVYGEGNPSVGILELVRFVTDVDTLYPPDLRKHYGLYRSPLKEPHDIRKAEADRLANWSARDQPPDEMLPSRAGRAHETDEQRFARIKERTLIAARAQQAARDELRLEEDRVALQDIEDKAFQRSQAAFNAKAPLPDHKELDQPGLRSVRARVFERCLKAFGWEHGAAPQVIPPSLVLPTDNPFEDDGEVPGGARGPEDGTPNSAQTSPVASEPGPAGEHKRPDIAALEDEARGLDQGPTAPAQEPPADDTLSKAYRELNKKTGPDEDAFQEPTF